MPKFNLMSYIMPPEDKMFFTYFQDSAVICRKAAGLYDEIMHNQLNEEYKEKALKYKQKFYNAARKRRYTNNCRSII